MYVVCLCSGCDGCCVFVCIVICGAAGALYGKCYADVMQMQMYICVMCASCGSSQC